MTSGTSEPQVLHQPNLRGSTADKSSLAFAMGAAWAGSATMVVTMPGSVLNLCLIGLLVAASIEAGYRKTGDLFSPPVFIGTMFFLYFPLRALFLLADSNPYTFPFLLVGLRGFVVNTSTLMLVGWMAWLGGYLVRDALPRRRSVSRFVVRPGTLSFSWVTTAAIVGVSARVVNFVFGNNAVDSNVPGEIGSMVNFAVALPYLAVAIATVEWCRRERSSANWISLAVLNAVSAGLGSSKGDLALAALCILIPYYYHRKRFSPKVMIACLVLVVFVLIPVGIAYRGALRGQFNSDTVYGETRAQLAEQFGGGLGAFAMSSIRASSFRLSGIEALAAAQARAPSEIPFVAYDSYALIVPSIVVPKVLWESKPNFGDSYDFAERYLQLPTAAISGVAVTPMGDLWIHGGWPPVVLGMMLLGLISRILYDWSRTPQLASYRGVVWFGLLFVATNWDSGFSLNVTRAARGVTLLVLALGLLGYRLRHGPSSRQK